MISCHTFVSYLRNLKIEGWIGYIQRVLNRWNPNLSIDPGFRFRTNIIFMNFIIISIDFFLDCWLNSKTLTSLSKKFAGSRLNEMDWSSQRWFVRRKRWSSVVLDSALRWGGYIQTGLLKIKSRLDLSSIFWLVKELVCIDSTSRGKKLKTLADLIVLCFEWVETLGNLMCWLIFLVIIWFVCDDMIISL